MHRSLTVLALSVTLAVALPVAGLAQGFSVNEHGSCVMGRGGTGVASPCSDGSTILFNPGGLAGTTGFTVSAGATVIAAGGAFQNDLYGTEDDIQNDPIPVPHAYIGYGINEQLAVGFGFFVPYGLGTKWNDTFEGAFLGYDNDLQSMYFQPTVAWQPHPKISIGAGLDYVVGKVKLTQLADLSGNEVMDGVTFGQLGIPFHTAFADGALEASGATGIGGNFGVLLEPADWISFGVRYMTQVKLDYEGDVVFTQVPTNIVLPPGNPLAPELGFDPTQPLPLDPVLTATGVFQAGETLGPQTVTTSITMPAQMVAGVAVDMTPTVKLLADWQWINWTVFDTLTVQFEHAPARVLEENYRSTHGFRVGIDAAATEALSVRGGYLYHGSASPPETVTPLLPEGTRNEFTLGFGYAFGTRASFDVAYQYLKQNERRGRVRDPVEGTSPTTALNSGLYSFYGHLFGATLAVHF